jgi:hypothetical protein
MSSFPNNLIKLLVSQKKYSVITEYTNIQFPDKGTLIVNEYAGDSVRVFKRTDNSVNILCPKDMSIIQEGNLTKAIETGEIFDDADDVDTHAKYIELSTLPNTAIINKGCKPPEKFHSLVSCVVGKMDDDNGHCCCGLTDMTNGYNFIKDVSECKENKTEVDDIVNDYLNLKKDNKLPSSIGLDMFDIKKELASLDDVSIEDVLSEDDYDELDPDNLYDKIKNDDYYDESFLSKKPKKLKPLDARGIVSYITVEMNNIQDSNDQAMLSGYTCSKLELVDFYLNVLDTQDDRYIVPHNRQYLVNFQTDLNKLLAQILRIRPVNKADRVWRVNVNYPEGWRG